MHQEEIQLEELARLDRVVAQAFHVTRAAARTAVEGGRVRVDGVAVTRAAHLVRGAVQLSLDPAQPPAGPELVTLLRDPLFLVIDKPSGLLVHAVGSRVDEPTVVSTLRAADVPLAGGQGTRVGVVHRLDRETSGVLLLALDAGAHHALSAQFRDRTIEKRYLALVAGAPATDEGVIDAPLTPARGSARRLVQDSPEARDAQTHFRLLECRGATSLLEVRPRTGRTHQIRAHLAAIGLPILGDRLYGAAAPGGAGAPRLLLHAWRLAFTHPADGTRVSVEAPVPTCFGYTGSTDA